MNVVHRVEIDNRIYQSIWEHLELYIPDAPTFDLVKLSELPEGYELEPLETASSISKYSIVAYAK